VNILLTGGAGYIGSHAAVVLSEAGHEVIIYDNFCNSDRSVLNRLEKILSKPLTCVEGDIRDTPLLEKTFQQYQIEAVIHFAGLKAVGESVADPLKYYDNNVVGSLKLLEAMKKTEIRTIVFSSSATVYGAPQYLPYDEEHPTNPINPYGQTKLQVEQILQDVCVSDPCWSVSLLRYFNPVGAHESGLIGEDPNGVPNNLMPYVAQVAIGQLPYLNIFGNDYDTKDGTGERDYIHVMDLAEGHLAALNYLINHVGCHIFNLGSGRATSVLELVESFKKMAGIDVPYRMESRRVGDLPAYYAKPAKAKRELLWQAQRTVDGMCASTWKWQQFRRSLK
jgi:UDP-glucose 4-epimerase